MAQPREQIPEEARWNVESLYPRFDDWQREFDEAIPRNQKPRWPELAAFKGKLGESAARLKKAIDCLLPVKRQLEKLYTYAHLRHDEDITHDIHKAAFQKIVGVLHDFAQESSWFDPELLALSDATAKAYLMAPELAEYRFFLQKIFHLKEHTLTPEMEGMLALAGKALDTAQKTFSAINDADFKFGAAIDGSGTNRELTHASYRFFMRDADRTLRKNAFCSYHAKYGEFENTLCELLSGKVQHHVFEARARNYPSSLHAALFHNNIDTQVYHGLIGAVNNNLDALHKYYDLRKDVLGLKMLNHYDLQVSLAPDLDVRIPYEEAEAMIIASVAPLGSAYQKALEKGLLEERWVDRYENKNKRSGGYSSGCYDSMPYILMNYKEMIRDVFVLAHEAGHSMHSLLSNRNQPYQYGNYSIFLAEVASTFHEDLLTRHLLEKARDREQKIFLINQKIEDIRNTLFRQTMFAEFELWLHTKVERDEPLTPAVLKEECQTLNAKYFGKSVVEDPQIAVEWARIPHFYYNFYVYQYATGISAALALAERVVQGGKKEREEYLAFLKGGSSRYPIDLLRVAGIDMDTPEPVNRAMATFRRLVRELEGLLKERKLALY